MVQATTTIGGMIVAPGQWKPYSWSYTKYKNWKNCPKKHWEVDVKKNFKEEEGEALVYGKEVHDAMAERIVKGTPLPHLFREFEMWIPRVQKGLYNADGTPVKDTVLIVEEFLSIKRDFTYCSGRDPKAWFRTKGDLLKVVGDVGLALDWKTGKIDEDSVQLALAAQVMFARFPHLKAVRSEFIWLKFGDAKTSAVYTRENLVPIWTKLWPELEQMERDTINEHMPPKPSGLCKRWCPVTSCQYHGKGSF